MLEALGFFALAEVVGLAAAPLAAVAFGGLPGAGLGFAKPIGLLLVTWIVWMVASIGLAPYTTTTVIVACLLYTSPSPRDGLLSRMPSSA